VFDVQVVGDELMFVGFLTDIDKSNFEENVYDPQVSMKW
jgi:hypothetical protein